jgi:fumarylacetoacetate (FAA) hydrolase
MIEILARGKPTTGFLRFGDRVRIEMFDADGRSIFGAIDQVVQPYNKASAGTTARRSANGGARC